MAHGEDDRPKKSWREIDAGRDKSTHRREERPSGGRKKLESSQAYRAYKSQLDKLFDGGGLPDALKSKLEESGVGLDAKRKKELTRKLIDATGPAAVRAALAEHRAGFGFPDDEEALAKLLDLDDGPIVLEAIGAVEKLLAEGGLKRGGSLKARVRTAQMTVDSPAVQAAAKALLAKL